MLNELQTWIIAHEKIVDKLLTILAVVIGGLLTYLTTIHNNKITAKRNSLATARDKVLVPLCVAIEDLIFSLSTYSAIPNFLEDSDIQVKTSKVLEFLSADKRVFLDKNIRSQLENYKMLLTALEKILQDDSSRASIFIMKSLEEALRSYDKIDYAMFIYVYIDRESVKKKMLAQSDVDPILLITGIKFEFNDDPENYKSKNYELKNKNSSEVLSALNLGYVNENENDLGLTQDEITFIQLIEFLYESSKEAVLEFNNILSSSQVHECYSQIAEALNNLLSAVLKKIDYITDL